RWLAVDCGSADHPMNTIIRDWQPRQTRQAEKVFKKKHGKTVAEFFDDSKYQLMHLDLFPHGIIHAECIGGDIDLLLNRRATIGFFPWRFVDGEACIGRCVAFVDDKDYDDLMKKKEKMSKTKFGDACDATHVERLEKLSKANLE
ncbi:MAG: cyclase family protein, partial [Chloroflexi bacterium]|nr:cyclase family protein [Chloroflexota bacterium]